MYDNTQRYGIISRLLHWTMAAGFAFMLFTVIMWKTNEEYFSLMAYHKSVGFLLAVLIVIRLVWAAMNLTKRPPSNLVAKLGHLALYGLMLAVPFIGLLRQYGSAKGSLAVFGVEVMGKAPEKVEWMAQLGNAAHGKLGFILFVLAIGHIGFAIWHQIKGEKILNRMAGK